MKEGANTCCAFCVQTPGADYMLPCTDQRVLDFPTKTVFRTIHRGLPMFAPCESVPFAKIAQVPESQIDEGYADSLSRKCSNGGKHIIEAGASPVIHFGYLAPRSGAGNVPLHPARH